MPALGTERDIPAWVQQGEAREDRKIEEAEEAAENGKAGRGAREKKVVKYTDNTTSSSSDGEDSDSGDDSASRPPAKRGRPGSAPAASASSEKMGRGRGRARGRPPGRGQGRGRGRSPGRGRGAVTPKAAAERAVVQEAPVEDEIDDICCMSCGRADSDESMVLCDGCENARHTFCCEPPLPGVPEDDWFCGVCAASPPDFRPGAAQSPE